MKYDPLEQACNQVLIDGLPSSLKACIDDMLRRGTSKAEILQRSRDSVMHNFAGTRKGRMTLLAIEAYLEAKP